MTFSNFFFLFFLVSFHVFIPDEVAEDDEGDEATLTAIFDDKTMGTFENLIHGVAAVGPLHNSTLIQVLKRCLKKCYTSHSKC